MIVPIISKEQSNVLWNTSWFCFLSAFYAFYREYYFLSLLPGGCFLTSINYWHLPDYSWRRYIDIIYVKCSVFLQTYHAYIKQAEHFEIYLVIMFMAIQFYIFGVYFYVKKHYWTSTFCHALLHLFANIANIILYSGKI